MKNLQASLANGHILVKDEQGRTLLIDTGSPVTLTRERVGEIQIGDQLVKPWTIKAFGQLFDRPDLTGRPVDVLVGNDVLCRRSWRLNLAGEPTFTWVKGFRPREDGLKMAYSRACNINMMAPVTEVHFGPETVKAIVDTGAGLSLSPREWLERHGGRVIGNRHEFCLGATGLAEFDTPLYAVPVTVGGETRIVTVGHTPAWFSAGMQLMAGTPFLLGTDLLFQHETVLYDAERQQFVLQGVREHVVGGVGDFAEKVA